MDERRSLAALVDLYLIRCDVEGKSAQTIRAYRETLGRFLRAIEEDGAPAEAERVTSEHIYGYLARFTSLSLETRHRYFREVRCFFNWLVEAEYLERGNDNPIWPHRDGLIWPHPAGRGQFSLAAPSLVRLRRRR